MGLAQLDSFWPNLTLLSPSQNGPGPTWLLLAQFDPTLCFFLAVQLVWLCQGVNSSSTFWLFQGVNNRSPSSPLAHFDLAVCFFLLFTASLTLSGGKEQKPILTLAHFDLRQGSYKVKCNSDSSSDKPRFVLLFCCPAHTDSLWPVLTRVKSGQAQFDAGQNGPGSQVGLEHWRVYEMKTWTSTAT